MKISRTIPVVGLLVALGLILAGMRFSAAPKLDMPEPAGVKSAVTEERTREAIPGSAAPRTPPPSDKRHLTQDEIRRRVLEQAEKVLAGNLGGLDQGSREELEKRIADADLQALARQGFGPANPRAFSGLARLAAYLDRLAAYKPAEADQLMVEYLNKRLTELESGDFSSGASELLDRWKRELSRDDGYEAVLIMGLEGKDEAGLKGALEFRRSILTPIQ